MTWINQLLIPLKYLRISHKTKKVYDWILPLGLAMVTCGIYYWVSEKPPILGKGGYLDQIQSLDVFLAPFFIAALAAVATFDRPMMDEELDGEPATLEIWDVNKACFITTSLTRRQFLSFLFGYLALLSILIFLISFMCSMFVNHKNMPCIFDYKNYAAPVFIFVHSFIFWNLMVNTLIGLFFLTEKINK
jgi:hypothetical protein